jgi:hypothetical protein
VLKGYFAACAATVAVKALKSVDLPTFGKPTIPHLKPMLVLLRILAVGIKPERIDYGRAFRRSLVLQVLAK